MNIGNVEPRVAPSNGHFCCHSRPYLIGRGDRRWLRKSQQPVSRRNKVAIIGIFLRFPFFLSRTRAATHDCPLLLELSRFLRLPPLSSRCSVTYPADLLPKMSANNMQALSACSRCFSRHPFEDLSPGQQLCKV